MRLRGPVARGKTHWVDMIEACGVKTSSRLIYNDEDEGG